MYNNHSRKNQKGRLRICASLLKISTIPDLKWQVYRLASTLIEMNAGYNIFITLLLWLYSTF